MAKSRHTEPAPFYHLIGDKIKELRFRTVYDTYETFANDTELDRKQYWRLESGSNITIKSLVRILSVNKLSLREFFNDVLNRKVHKAN